MGPVWDMLPMDTLLPSLLSMLPPLWLLPPLLFMLLPPSLLPITATPRSPPLPPSPPLVPPLLLSPPSEDSMPELDGMSPTPPELSMLPRGRLRLIPMFWATVVWAMLAMEVTTVWDMLVMEAMPVLDMPVPMLLDTPKSPLLLPSPPLVPPLPLSLPSEDSMLELAGMSPTPPELSMSPEQSNAHVLFGN